MDYFSLLIRKRDIICGEDFLLLFHSLADENPNYSFLHHDLVSVIFGYFWLLPFSQEIYRKTKTVESNYFFRERLILKTNKNHTLRNLYQTLESYTLVRVKFSFQNRNKKQNEEVPIHNSRYAYMYVMKN